MRHSPQWIFCDVGQAWLVSSFAFLPSRANFFHQVDNGTTPPARSRRAL